MDSKNGIVFLKKAEGKTSFQSLSLIKKRLGHKKVGHTGTLDKFAQGLLIALAGNCTRLTPYFMDLPKTYTGVIRFGQKTSTLDPQGQVVETGRIPGYSEILDKLPAFTGRISQVPPDYSAIHVDGKRAYQRVLAGESPDLKPRDIEIYEFAALDWDAPDFRFRVGCSKGTYVRSLARDLGAALGSCAYLSSLCREKVGPFDLSMASDEESFSSGDLKASGEVLPLLPGFGHAEVLPEAEAKVANGQPFEESFLKNSQSPSDGLWLLSGSAGNLLAIMEKQNDRCSYRLVFGKD